MKTMGTLTERQQEVLHFIHKTIEDTGMPPTHDEIRDGLGLKSAFGVRQHLRLIQAKGHLKVLPNTSRGLRIAHNVGTVRVSGMKHIPLIGSIAAGTPILAEENIERSITIDEDLYPTGILFALRVRGNSMVDIGIRSGDWAVIRQQPEVECGQVAAVRIDDEATLKRVYREPGQLRLKAENIQVEDICIRSESGSAVRVEGLYVGLIRKAVSV